MILLAALLLGLAAGLGLALANGKAYVLPDLRHLWLVPAALLPQVLLAYLPAGQALPARSAAAVVGPLSLALLLVFVWLNLAAPGMSVLLIGLALNFLVISANGGWMPISPETGSQLPGWEAARIAKTGVRVGEKDILLRRDETRLEPLADRYLLPDWLGYRAAFSLGDVFVAAGAIWMLASPPVLSKVYRRQHAYG